MSVTNSTVGVYAFSASGDTVTTPVFVRDMSWVCTTASTAGDHLLVQEYGSTLTVMEAYASGAYTRTQQPFHRMLNGIIVASMTSGTLYVYTGKPLPWG